MGGWTVSQPPSAESVSVTIVCGGGYEQQARLLAELRMTRRQRVAGGLPGLDAAVRKANASFALTLPREMWTPRTIAGARVRVLARTCSV